jgi:hypothetical protein
MTDEYIFREDILVEPALQNIDNRLERHRSQIHEGGLLDHLVLEHTDGSEWVMEDVGAVKAPVSLLCDMLPSLFREEGKRTCSVSLEADTSTVRTVLFLGIDFIEKRSFYFRKQKKHESVLILAQKKGSEQPNRLPVPHFHACSTSLDGFLMI